LLHEIITSLFVIIVIKNVEN